MSEIKPPEFPFALCLGMDGHWYLRDAERPLVRAQTDVPLGEHGWSINFVRVGETVIIGFPHGQVKVPVTTKIAGIHAHATKSFLDLKLQERALYEHTFNPSREN